MTEKQRALEAVQHLPDDATVEDAIERLCFINKVQKGLRELDSGQRVSHDEAKRRIVGGYRSSPTVVEIVTVFHGARLFVDSP